MFNSHLRPPAFPNLYTAPTPSVPTCPHCWLICNLQLPRIQDFALKSYQGSTRISEFHLDVNNCWLFRNFRGELYFRSNTYPRSWYYQHPQNNISVVLCEIAALDLDQTYGRFLPPVLDFAYNWLHRGYVKWYMNGCCVVSFSPDEYHKQYADQNSRTTSNFQNAVSPPPGFSATALVQSMDVDVSQQQVNQEPAPNWSNSGDQTYNQANANQPNMVTTQGMNLVVSYDNNNPETVCQDGSHNIQGNQTNSPATDGPALSLDMSRVMMSLQQGCAISTRNVQNDSPMEGVEILPQIDQVTNANQAPEPNGTQENARLDGDKIVQETSSSVIIEMGKLSPTPNLPPKAIDNEQIGAEHGPCSQKDGTNPDETKPLTIPTTSCEKPSTALKSNALAEAETKLQCANSGQNDTTTSKENRDFSEDEIITLDPGKTPKDKSDSPPKAVNEKQVGSELEPSFKDGRGQMNVTHTNDNAGSFASCEKQVTNDLTTNDGNGKGTQCHFALSDQKNPENSNCMNNTNPDISDKELLALDPENKNPGVKSECKNNLPEKPPVVPVDTKGKNESRDNSNTSRNVNANQTIKFPSNSPAKSPEKTPVGMIGKNQSHRSPNTNKSVSSNQTTRFPANSSAKPQSKRVAGTGNNQGRKPQNPQKEKYQNVPDKQKIEKAFCKLQENLSAKYLQRSLEQSLPTCARNQDTTLSSVFDLIVKYQDEKTKSVATSSDLMKNTSESRRRILVQGEPAFGKTTLCTIVARRWSLKPTKRCRLCIYCHLPSLGFQKDLEQTLINSCLTNMDSSGYVSFVSQALEENRDHILLILDGFDALPEDEQKVVQSFLTSNGLFSKSYFLVTTRPTSDNNFLQVFNIHGYIRGFSPEYFERFLAQNQSKTFFNIFGKQQLRYLSELSPYFTSVMAEAAKENLYNEKRRSLYDLLDGVVQVLISQNVSADFSPNHVQVLGEKLFFALIWNKYTFTEDQLKRFFGDYYNVFLKCNIFYRQSLDRTKLTVSSKILMVYFATMYLRIAWGELLNDKERTNFLKDVFCSGCCDGDYVSTEDGCLYYVGLLPEVVLKIGKTRSLEDSTFEMYYDVARVECSHAFDSVNLLSRIKQSHLRRFNFECKPDDCVCHSRTFDSIYKVMSFDSCSINCNFYSNPVEGTDFMKVEADGSTNNTLQAVLRARQNGKLDRMYVDFEFSELAEVFEFVNTLLCSYSSDVELAAELNKSSLPHFIETLVERIFSSSSSRSATVTCSNDDGDFNRRLYACFSISSNPETGKRCLLISYKNPMMDQTFLSFSKYRFCDLNAARIAVLSAISDCENFAPNLRITINFL